MRQKCSNLITNTIDTSLSNSINVNPVFLYASFNVLDTLVQSSLTQFTATQSYFGSTNVTSELEQIDDSRQEALTFTETLTTAIQDLSQAAIADLAVGEYYELNTTNLYLTSGIQFANDLHSQVMPEISTGDQIVFPNSFSTIGSPDDSTSNMTMQFTFYSYSSSLYSWSEPSDNQLGTILSLSLYEQQIGGAKRLNVSNLEKPFQLQFKHKSLNETYAPRCRWFNHVNKTNKHTKSRNYELMNSCIRNDRVSVDVVVCSTFL
jgi:hypothetical protein